jgi:pimeloyl-ACP methyl ester carboxylesterase
MFEASRGRPLAVRVAAILATAVLGVWAASVAALWSFESRLVFQAHRTHYMRVLAAPIEFGESIALRTTDGVRLEAVALTRDAAPGYWILFCSPSGGSLRRGVGGQIQALHEMGYSVLAFDYRGFGRTAGTPSEAGLYRDALTAYRYLTDRRRVPPHRIIVAGRSLGSAVAVDLAARVPSAGLLLLSAIDSVPATAARLYRWAPVHLLASYRFDSLSKAARIHVPVLQVHSPRDRLIPLGAARALFEQFPGSKLMLEAAGGHNRAGFAGDGALEEALAAFWPPPSPGVLARGAESD